MPLGRTRKGKSTSLKKKIDSVSENSILHECENVIVMGDFNLNFEASEMKNRLFSPQESRLAKIVEGFYLASLGRIRASGCNWNGYLIRSGITLPACPLAFLALGDLSALVGYSFV